MKAMNLIALALGHVVLSSAHAAILDVKKSDTMLEGVALGTTATTTTAGKTTALEFQSSGVRKKKVLVVKAKVYVAQLYVDQKSKFVKTAKEANLETDTTSLNSVGNLGTVALKLDFLRDLSADKVVDSFSDALKANKLDPAADEGLKKVLAAVKKSGDVASGESISIVGINDGTADQLIIENSKGASETIIGDAKLVEKMFAIWLGVPADGGLETLKGELTQ